MKCSIIVTNFNYGHYVSEAISSALAQSYTQTEVIVVDDGSTDGSRARIDEFGDRITSIYKTNGGQGSAINAGFAASHGDIIIFLDADDRLEPDCVSSVVAAWQTPLAKLHFRLRVIDAKGLPTGLLEPAGALPAGDLSAEVRCFGAYRAPPNSGNAYSRAFLNCVMPVPEGDWRAGNDCYLIVLAPLYGEIGAIDRTLGCYRKHGVNMSSFVVDGRVRLAGLHNDITLDERVAGALETHISKLDGKMKAAPAPGLYKLKLRLASKKMSPKTHPIVSDSVRGLTWRLIFSLSRASGMGVARKTAYILWALAMYVAPRFAVEPLIKAVYPTRQNRSG